jgi:hypothetical protein
VPAHPSSVRPTVRRRFGPRVSPCRAREPTKGRATVLASVAHVDAQDRERRSEHHCRTDDRHQG